MSTNHRLVELLRDLVSCNSVNPSLAGGPGEAGVATLVAKRLEGFGLRPELQTIERGRVNVVATVPGLHEGPTLLFNAHLDTVGTGGMQDPFRLLVDGDRLYGRGAYDMKGSVAIMLCLAERFAAQAPPGDVVLTFVADEEHRSRGTEHLLESLLSTEAGRPDAAFVLEPTEEIIGIAHKGFVWQEIEIRGRAAHGSRPEEGIDAAFPLASALRELNVIAEDLGARPPHPLVGQGSLHVSTIEGGSAWSVIPDRVRVGWERRTVPGDSLSDADVELARVVEAARAHPGLHTVTGQTIFARQPFRSDPDSLPVRLLQEVRADLATGGVSFWADSALIGEHVPTVLYGPAGHGAHATDEWISLESMQSVFDTLEEMIRLSGRVASPENRR